MWHYTNVVCNFVNYGDGDFSHLYIYLTVLYYKDDYEINIVLWIKTLFFFWVTKLRHYYLYIMYRNLNLWALLFCVRYELYFYNHKNNNLKIYDWLKLTNRVQINK